MSTPINAANGASIGFREAPANSRAPRSCIAETVRDPSNAPSIVNRPALMWETTRSSNMNNAKFSATPVPKPVISKSTMPGNELLGMPPPLQQSAYDAAGHRTGRGRKNEQYCDGDGGKRIA